MTIESSLHIFLEIFAYFAQVHVIDDDDDVEAKTYLPDFHTFGFCSEVDDAWQHKPRVGRVDKVCIIHH